MLPDAQIPPETQAPVALQPQLLAPWWHTACLIVVLLFASLNGTRGHHPLAGHSKLPQYWWGMAWEWILLTFTWLGIRKRIALRTLIGGRWGDLSDFLRDLFYAAAFWVCAISILGIGAKLMHLDQAGKIDTMRKQLGFLAPGSRLELATWFCLSATAGFCEEIIFRGYLQRQFAAFGKSTLVGVLLSAVIFGASHGYEGGARMLLIGIYGLMFGLLAWWRNSLRPGMLAHAWHDAFSGLILRMLK